MSEYIYQKYCWLEISFNFKANTNMTDFVNNDCTNISTVKAIWTNNPPLMIISMGENTGLPTNAIYNMR